MFTFQIAKIIAGSIICILISFAAAPMIVEGEPASPTPGATAESLPVVADEMRGEPVRLVAPRGRIDLRVQPAGAEVRHVAEAGRLARVVDVAGAGTTVWFLIRLESNRETGWVPSESLILSGTAGPAFERPQFCTGSHAHPATTCGETLPVPGDALWLQWTYSGLKRGDVVQRLLVVNGERYQSAPVVWNGPRTGRKLVNLVDAHQPPLEPGEWTVRFIINGEFAGEASVELR